MKQCRFFAVVSLIFFLSVLLVAFPAQASLIDNEKVTLSGFFKNATSLNVSSTDSMDQFLKIRNTAQLSLEYRFTDNFHLFTIVRGWYDSVYDAESRWRKGDNRSEMSRVRGTDWLRECYLDYYSQTVDVRVGKQQVVWGTADGVKILDIINPIDYREFSLEINRGLDADVKIPLWMTKVEYAPTVNGTLQLLIIPDYETNFLAPPQAPYSARATNVGDMKLDELRNLGAQVNISKKKPGKTFDNTKIALRWLDVIKGFEYTINYLHGYSYSPSRYFIGIEPFGIPFIPGAVAYFEDRYPQTETLGFSFSKAMSKGFLRGYNFRGEFAWVHNSTSGYGIKDDQIGVAKVDQYNYVLGIDKYYWTNWLFSFQFIQFCLGKKTEDGYNFISGPTFNTVDQFETILSLKVATDFMHERIKPGILTQWGANNNDWSINPRVEYELRDYLILTWGMNAFWGPSDSLFGYYKNRDTMYLEVKFGF